MILKNKLTKEKLEIPYSEFRKKFVKEIQDKYKKLCVSYVEADVITTKIDKCKFNNDANILGAILDVSKKK